jgi:plastocyanin
VVVATLATACGGSSGGTGTTGATGAGATGAAARPTIEIKNFEYSPRTLTVAPGATVQVVNQDSVTHTLTSATDAFDTGNVQPGATAQFQAPRRPGRYPYQCSIHPFMMGILVVR